MKRSFNPTCDRYGHLLTGLGGSPQVMEPFAFPTAKEMAFLPGTGNDRVSAPNPQAMRADLIVMPAPLDAASENWSTSEVVDELARKAGCPVLAGKAII